MAGQLRGRHHRSWPGTGRGCGSRHDAAGSRSRQPELLVVSAGSARAESRRALVRLLLGIDPGDRRVRDAGRDRARFPASRAVACPSSSAQSRTPGATTRNAGNLLDTIAEVAWQSLADSAGVATVDELAQSVLAVMPPAADGDLADPAVHRIGGGSRFGSHWTVPRHCLRADDDAQGVLRPPTRRQNRPARRRPGAARPGRGARPRRRRPRRTRPPQPGEHTRAQPHGPLGGCSTCAPSVLPAGITTAQHRTRAACCDWPPHWRGTPLPPALGDRYLAADAYGRAHHRARGRRRAASRRAGGPRRRRRQVPRPRAAAGPAAPGPAH